MKTIITILLFTAITLSSFSQSSDKNIIRNLKVKGTEAFLKTDTVFLKKILSSSMMVVPASVAIVAMLSFMKCLLVFHISGSKFIGLGV